MIGKATVIMIMTASYTSALHNTLDSIIIIRQTRKLTVVFFWFKANYLVEVIKFAPKNHFAIQRPFPYLHFCREQVSNDLNKMHNFFELINTFQQSQNKGKFQYC